MIQFFAPGIATSPVLPPEESAHCCRVLRRREGDTVYATDGRGYRYECRIVKADPRATMLSVESRTEIAKPWPGKIHLAIAPVKNAERNEWLVEKAVEIGVDRIIPLQCEHSERKVVRLDRLQRIAVSAANQSLKTYIPEISGVTPLPQLLAEPFSGQKIAGYCADDVERILLHDALKPHTDTLLLIGPEGDFSPAEARMLLDAGFTPASFGYSRMRAETAALFALSAFHFVNLSK